MNFFFRIKLVNAAIVDYFMEDLSLVDHFVSLRRFLFLEDGEFGQRLSDLLFEKVEKYAILRNKMDL